MKTAAGRERERAYGEILVAAVRRPVTGGCADCRTQIDPVVLRLG
jgi:hypothetical protein